MLSRILARRDHHRSGRCWNLLVTVCEIPLPQFGGWDTSPASMRFRAVFIAITIATALIISAFLINSRRPRVDTQQPSAAFVRASGKCAECHRNTHYSVVHEYEMSAHARKGINCLDCHQVAAGQKSKDHHGFVINAGPTPANCRSCHETVYQQFATQPPCGGFVGGRGGGQRFYRGTGQFRRTASTGQRQAPTACARHARRFSRHQKRLPELSQHRTA